MRRAILRPAAVAFAECPGETHARDRRRKAADNTAKALVLVVHLTSNTQRNIGKSLVGNSLVKKTYMERKIGKL